MSTNFRSAGQIVRSWFTPLKTKPIQRNKKRGRLYVESLEFRVMPAVLFVNSLNDNATANDGLVTLREAILAANTDATTDRGDTGSGADTIQFADGLAGAINLSTVEGGLGTLTITSNLTIEGPSARVITISGGDAVQVFSISGKKVNWRSIPWEEVFALAPSLSTTVALKNLNISNGKGENGGGISINQARVSLSNMSVYENNATGQGGGIYARNSVVSIDGSIISNNESTAGIGGGNRDREGAGFSWRSGNRTGDGTDGEAARQAGRIE